jgi:hypothetical protein
MRDYLEISTVPCGEKCAQVGTDNYRENVRKECRRYIKMLTKRFPYATSKNGFGIKWFPHDFGSYAEVVIYFDDQDEMSQAYAFHVEGNLPETWDDDELCPFIEDYENS